MFHPIFALVLVFSFFTISSGQPLPSGRQATVEDARMEQRILANIRPLLIQLSSCEASAEKLHKADKTSGVLSATIQNLTKRIEAIEKSITSLCRGDYLVSFGNLESNASVHVFEDQCSNFLMTYTNRTDAQAFCQFAGASLMTDSSRELLTLIIKTISDLFG
ncbi:uncharacterized protein LOC117335855 isoform X1 [Pecten maximus]|uniref:uncharacterized protein LOC117335855 isoform X1 n=1 Tax=Pecten maximus TaxID=6579 RepID=UPI00145821C0|nr:uncharacterized protein LOC117335855 isoform X1 [Pecten maximus]